MIIRWNSLKSMYYYLDEGSPKIVVKRDTNLYLPGPLFAKEAENEGKYFSINGHHNKMTYKEVIDYIKKAKREVS